MSMLERFKDSEYKNWLRCVNAQISLKESLHVFVDMELKTLHRDMSKQVKDYVGSSPTVQCNLCTSRDIHQIPATRQSTSKWSITCPSNICNIWLDEILAVHNDPNNKSINWQNTDVSLWAVEPYEIAKVFMPRGADKANAFPKDLDLPAILSLMKLCKAFEKYKVNTRLLEDITYIRNKLYHSGDFKINDKLRDSWIEKMLQLVTDLNLQCTVYSELYMVMTDDMIITLGQTESRVFQELVFSRFHHIESEMNTLQNTQIQLTTDVRQVMECTSNADRRTDLLHDDLSEVKTQVQEMTTVSDKVSDMEQRIEEKEHKGIVAEKIKHQRKHNGKCANLFLVLGFFNALAGLVLLSLRENIYQLFTDIILIVIIARILEIISGILSVICTFLHCMYCDLIKNSIRKSRLVGFYRFLLVAMFLCGMASVFLSVCFITKTVPNYHESLKKKINDIYEGNPHSKEPFTLAFDMAQTQFQCCGLDVYRDFYNATKWNRTLSSNQSMLFPTACCIKAGHGELISDTCPFDGLDSNKDKPCWKSILESMVGIEILPLSLNSLQLFWNLIALCYEICVCVIHKRQQNNTAEFVSSEDARINFSSEMSNPDL